MAHLATFIIGHIEFIFVYDNRCSATDIIRLGCFPGVPETGRNRSKGVGVAKGESSPIVAFAHDAEETQIEIAVAALIFVGITGKVAELHGKHSLGIAVACPAEGLAIYSCYTGRICVVVYRIFVGVCP